MSRPATDPMLDHHPRPTLQRTWATLDGLWDFTIDTATRSPGGVSFDDEITVPFAPESLASGVGYSGRVECCWYRRIVDLDAVPGNGRPVVHFAGVDRIADVWVDGQHARRHVGGYAPFTVELPEPDRSQVEVIVRAVDPADDLTAPRGKQDWNDEPHGIWYPRTTGIWKTVWVERVPETSITEIEWTADVSAMTIRMRATLDGAVTGDRLHVRLTVGERTLVDDEITTTGQEVERVFPIGDGGFDDRHGLLWWPSRPTLIDARVALVRESDVVDAVDSYTALRQVEVCAGAFRLNGRPFQLRMVLDQGYWPESGATPSSVDALRTDIELARSLGFNTVRKHQKTEDPRYFALADRIGLLVWVEMPSAFRSGRAASAALTAEWAEIVAAHRNHPSVAAWVPINESWGVDACSSDPAQRATIEALAALTDALDSTRPVSANDGWETVGGDIVGVHDYDQQPDGIRHRWGSAAAIDAQLVGFRPDGRRSDLDGAPAGGRAVMLSEFGGTALRSDTGDSTFGTENWGYDNVASGEQLLERFRALWTVVHQSDGLAGACWTQLTDTYQEVNGLLRADRTPKLDVDAARRVTTGADLASPSPSVDSSATRGAHTLAPDSTDPDHSEPVEEP